MRLLLHIGTAKTGTTGLQGWAHRNRDALADAGIWYPRRLGAPNHRKVPVAAQDPSRLNKSDNAAMQFGVLTPQDHAQFVPKVRREVAKERAEAEARGAHTFVVSSEHLSFALHSVEEIQRVRDLLGDFEETSVACFLRPAVDVLVSGLSTRARGGRAIPTDLRRPSDGSEGSGDGADLRVRLANWAEVFGRDAVHPIAFKRNPSSVAAMCELLDLDPHDFAPEVRENSRLDHRTVALANHLALPRFTDEGKQRMLFRGWDALPVEHPLTVGRPVVEALHEGHLERIAAFVADWPELTEDDLTPDFSRYPEVGTYEQLDDCDFSPMTRAMVQQLRADAEIARAEVHLHRGRSLLGRGRVVAASRELAQARTRLADAATVPNVVIPADLEERVASTTKILAWSRRMGKLVRPLTHRARLLLARLR